MQLFRRVTTATLFLVLLLMAGVTGCAHPRRMAPMQHETLEPRWVLTSLPCAPTAAVAWEGMWLVAGFDPNAPEGTETGRIALLSAAGKLIDAQWLSNLRRPSSLAIHRDRLLVTDENQLLTVSLENRRIEHRVRVPDVLTDVTVAPGGEVYAASTAGNAIYRQVDGETTLWFRSPLLPTPNSVVAESLFLTVHSAGFLYRISYGTRTMSRMTRRSQAMGDIITDGRGGLWFSDWTSGQLGRVRPSGHVLLEAELPLVGGVAYDANRQALLAITPHDLCEFGVR